MLESIARDLWTHVEPLSMMGIQFGNRTTIIRLENEELLLHSPGELNNDFLNELKSLGKVAYIVAPNRYHSLFLEDYMKEYPDIKIFMAPGLEKKRKDLACTGLLGDEPEAAWESVLDQHYVKGIPAFNEVVFFHRVSKTLILTDLAVNMLNPKGLLTRFHFYIHGASRRFAFSRIVKMMIKDKTSFQASLSYILSWDFDRVVVSHGEIVETGGKEKMKNIFSNYSLATK